MSRRILYIGPVKGEAGQDSGELASEVQDGTELRVVTLGRGPSHVEYHYYEALVLVDLLHTIKKAEQDGFDAAVIGCFYDPGLTEAREITERMVVTAPCEASTQIACSLGHKFSIIVGRRKWVPQMMDAVHRYGLKDRLASFKSVDLGVLEFHQDEEEAAQRFRIVGREAIEVDGAEVLILGCTATYGFYRELQEELGVPVIDASIAALKHAEFLIELKEKFGWTHSKIGGYESPPVEEIKAWCLEEQYGFADMNLWP